MKLQKTIKFEVSSVKHIDMSAYDNDDYMIARTAFLSTRPNSHEIVISEDVLRKYAPSVLGKWVTAEVFYGDCTTHTDKQAICGIVPKEQDVEYIEADDGYLDAYVDCIISKRYAKEYCNVFSENDVTRSVSIEATFSMVDEHECDGFDIKTITTLGKSVRPSVPNANIKIVRFSEEDAENYYNNLHKSDSLSNLKQFAEERKQAMAEKKYISHPVNTSKDAVYTGDWDGNKAKQDLIEEKNYKSLAPKVCLKLEDGWENREVTKLGYPVMGLYDGEWRYSTKALSSAQAYAEQNDESEVLNKIKAIKKKLGLDDTERKEEAKMEETKMAETETKVEEKPNETEMAEIEGRKAWGKVIEKVQEHEGKGAYVDSIEDNHIIYTKDDVRYRVDADVKVGEDDKEVDADIKWDTVKKDADQKMSEEEAPCEMSLEDAKAEIDRLSTEIENRDNIIMGKDKEIAELTEFKQKVLEKERAITVEATMAEIKDYVDNLTYNDIREEGLNCKFDEIDGWINKAKAICFGAVKKTRQRNNGDTGVWSFAAPIEPAKKTTSIWN